MARIKRSSLTRAMKRRGDQKIDGIARIIGGTVFAGAGVAGIAGGIATSGFGGMTLAGFSAAAVLSGGTDIASGILQRRRAQAASRRLGQIAKYMPKVAAVEAASARQETASPAPPASVAPAGAMARQSERRRENANRLKKGADQFGMMAVGAAGLGLAAALRGNLSAGVGLMVASGAGLLISRAGDGWAKDARHQAAALKYSGPRAYLNGAARRAAASRPTGRAVARSPALTMAKGGPRGWANPAVQKAAQAARIRKGK